MNVTLHATATTSPARDDANPALMAALAVTALAAGTIAGAWYFQLVLDIRPCPLCLEQRYAYYLAIPLGALIVLPFTLLHKTKDYFVSAKCPNDEGEVPLGGAY